MGDDSQPIDFSTEIYKPQVVRQGKWEGHVKVKLLDFEERYALMDEARKQGDGEHFNLMRRLVKDWKDRFLEVRLTRKKDGRTFNSYAELQYGPDCHAILVDVCSALLNGQVEDESGN